MSIKHVDALHFSAGQPRVKAFCKALEAACGSHPMLATASTHESFLADSLAALLYPPNPLHLKSHSYKDVLQHSFSSGTTHGMYAVFCVIPHTSQYAYTRIAEQLALIQDACMHLQGLMDSVKMGDEVTGWHPLVCFETPMAYPMPSFFGDTLKVMFPPSAPANLNAHRTTDGLYRRGSVFHMYRHEYSLQWLQLMTILEHRMLHEGTFPAIVTVSPNTLLSMTDPSPF